MADIDRLKGTSYKGTRPDKKGDFKGYQRFIKKDARSGKIMAVNYYDSSGTLVGRIKYDKKELRRGAAEPNTADYRQQALKRAVARQNYDDYKPQGTVQVVTRNREGETFKGTKEQYEEQQQREAKAQVVLDSRTTAETSATVDRLSEARKSAVIRPAFAPVRHSVVQSSDGSVTQSLVIDDPQRIKVRAGVRESLYTGSQMSLRSLGFNVDPIGFEQSKVVPRQQTILENPTTSLGTVFSFAQTPLDLKDRVTRARSVRNQEMRDRSYVISAAPKVSPAAKFVGRAETAIISGLSRGSFRYSEGVAANVSQIAPRSFKDTTSRLVAFEGLAGSSFYKNERAAFAAKLRSKSEAGFRRATKEFKDPMRTTELLSGGRTRTYDDKPLQIMRFAKAKGTGILFAGAGRSTELANLAIDRPVTTAASFYAFGKLGKGLGFGAAKLGGKIFPKYAKSNAFSKTVTVGSELSLLGGITAVDVALQPTREGKQYAAYGDALAFAGIYSGIKSYGNYKARKAVKKIKPISSKGEGEAITISTDKKFFSVAVQEQRVKLGKNVFDINLETKTFGKIKKGGKLYYRSEGLADVSKVAGDMQGDLVMTSEVYGKGASTSKASAFYEVGDVTAFNTFGGKTKVSKQIVGGISSNKQYLQINDIRFSAGVGADFRIVPKKGGGVVKLQQTLGLSTVSESSKVKYNPYMAKNPFEFTRTDSLFKTEGSRPRSPRNKELGIGLLDRYVERVFPKNGELSISFDKAGSKRGKPRFPDKPIYSEGSLKTVQEQKSVSIKEDPSVSMARLKRKTINKLTKDVRSFELTKLKTRAKTVSRNVGISALATNLVGGLKSRQQTRVRSEEIATGSLVSIPEMLTATKRKAATKAMTKSAEMTRIRGGQEATLKRLTASKSLISTPSPRFNFDLPPPPPPPRFKIPFLPSLPTFDLGQGYGRRGRGSKHKTKYVADIGSALFGLRGKTPKALTGLESRPIPIEEIKWKRKRGKSLF